MIGMIEGNVKELLGKKLIVMVSGVGYLVSVPPSIIQESKPASKISLFIHTHVKEDALDLYGFTNKPELSLFEMLLSVSGIGPKTAMNILSAGKVTEIASAISRADADFFRGVTGIGKKGAQKIIIDLRSKVGGIGEDVDFGSSTDRDSVIEALKVFGFSERESREALKALPKDKPLSLEEKIRHALKSLGR